MKTSPAPPIARVQTNMPPDLRDFLVQDAQLHGQSSLNAWIVTILQAHREKEES